MMTIMHPAVKKKPYTTLAAEGLPRRAFTIEDIEAMVEAGLIGEKERIELIGGEIVPMSPKGNHHEVLKTLLTIYWAKRLPDDLLFTTETTFRITPDTYLEPDFVFYTVETGVKGLNPATALLVTEVADSSLSYDRGRKAQLYASFGVAELWVIDAVRLNTRVYREPSAEGYKLIRDFAGDEETVPLAIPKLGVTLNSLDRR